MLQGKIVGGDEAEEDENPFQVALLLSESPDNAAAQFCGGTLVSANMVVTAAHCSDFITAGDVQVLAGARSLDGSADRHDVASITIHPNWDDVTFDNDVAVWELADNVTDVPFAGLATEDGPVGGNLLVTGWGTLTEGGNSPIDLHAVTVPLVSVADCNDADSYDGQITGTMLCAGLDQGGQDACQGDSGGPLTRGPNNADLTGVVSWGIGCAREDFYGVYARVSSPGIREFIIDIVGTELAEDCIGHDVDSLAVVTIDEDVKITEGSHWLMSFGDKLDEAERTLEIMQAYGTSEQCFVGRPDPSLTYVLVQGSAPSGAVSGEDCIAHDLDNLSILDEGSHFILTDGQSRMVAFPNRDEAETALSLIRSHGFTNICYVGRPGPSFVYMRT